MVQNIEITVVNYVCRQVFSAAKLCHYYFIRVRSQVKVHEEFQLNFIFGIAFGWPCDLYILAHNKSALKCSSVETIEFVKYIQDDKQKWKGRNIQTKRKYRAVFVLFSFLFSHSIYL